MLFKGKNSKRIDIEDRRSVVILPQNPYLLKRLVFDNIAYGLKIRGQKEELEKKVFDALFWVGLDSSFAKRKWSQLSGGEAQRVALAARLILKPEVLILDEPTSSVDTNSAQQIKEAIFFAKEKWNTTLMISSHDHSWLNQACDRKIALFQGKIVQNSAVNLLFAPWLQDENGNLVKLFGDGQRLCIKNSQKKKKDTVVMINSKDVAIYPKNYAFKEGKPSLLGIIISIEKQNLDDDLIVETVVGGVKLSGKISKKELLYYKLLPGEKATIRVDTDRACWL